MAYFRDQKQKRLAVIAGYAALGQDMDLYDGDGPMYPPSRSDFEINLEHVYSDAITLCLKKHKDYGPKNISLSPGGPLNGLRVRLWDKQARLNNLIDSGATPQNESLRDSFVDMLNYCAIAIMVLDGNWPSE